MALVKLYGMALSPKVIRVAAALNEMGLDFEIVHVDLRTDAHKKPDYLALNPFGQIPALQDGTKSSTCSAKLETWLEVESHHFYPAVSLLVFQLLIKPTMGGTPDAAVVDKNVADLTKVLDVYEAHLAKGNKYLADDAFTQRGELGDLEVGPMGA